MPHVAVDTLLMIYFSQRVVVCSREELDEDEDELVLQEYLLKEYAGAMLVQVMQILAGLWCGSSICSQLSLVHMIGRGSRQKAKFLRSSLYFYFFL